MASFTSLAELIGLRIAFSTRFTNLSVRVA